MSPGINIEFPNPQHNSSIIQESVRVPCLNCHMSPLSNDLTIGWQNLNPLSHPNATLVPQARQARASGENLNYVTLAPQARQSGEILPTR